MKKQSKKSKMLKSIGLFLVRLLYCCIEGWMYFGFNWISETELGINVSALVIFVVMALAMGALEAVWVHKSWNDEVVNKRVLVVKSVVIVFLPILLYYLIFYVIFPVSTMLGIGVYN